MNITRRFGSESDDVSNISTAQVYAMAQAYEAEALKLSQNAGTSEDFAKATALHQKADDLMNVFYSRDPSNPRNEPEEVSSSFSPLALVALGLAAYFTLK